MTAGPIDVCASADVIDGGDGVRFPVGTRDGATTAFVVRFRGSVRGYLNRCAHVGVELDWDRGKFFESSGLYLMCATHGAIYAPETGRCAGVRAVARDFRVVTVEERDGRVWFVPDASTFAPPPAPTNPS